MALIPLSVGSWPGVHLAQSTDGYIPSDLGDHSSVYLLGTSATGTDNTVTAVASLADFTNQFGASPSTIHVDAFFTNDELGTLFFVKAGGNTAADYMEAIDSALVNPLLRQGYLICPEGFSTLAVAADRTLLATAMIDHCQREHVQWVALIDASRAAGSSVTALLAERADRNSERGHGALYAPWINFKGTWIAPTSVVAGIATRRNRTEGFNSAPAGMSFLPRGVVDVETNYTDALQGQLNLAGVNCFRKFSTGVTLWGARTTSVTPYFRFIHQRVVFNVIAVNLQRTLKILMFEIVDGQGMLFRRIKKTIDVLLQRYWEAGALYGATSKDAFLVVCDRTNNPNLDLENGIVRVDAYAVPSPTMERLAVRLVRVPIGHFEANVV
jgi:uncharacterized protein